MKLLHIDAGITPGSVSRQLSAAVVGSLVKADPTLDVARLDLEATPVPHLTGQGLAGLADNPLLAQFVASDVIVIGAPMYNFGIPSQLKAWFDHIAVAGKTFRYTNAGVEGLAGGKTVVIASARGGVYAEGPMAAMDFQEPYIRSLFRFIGIDDIRFVRAEGVAISPDHRETALAAGLAAASGVTRPAALAA